MESKDAEVEFPEERRDAQLVYEAAALFFSQDGNKTRFNATKLRDALRLKHPDAKLSRESIYPLLARAVDYGFVRFVPPVTKAVARKLKARFQRARDVEIVVVNTRGREFNEAVGAAAAQVALRLLTKLREVGYDTVGLGLGPGKSGLDFAKSLSSALEAVPGLPRLNLFGITAGCIPSAPEFAPVSFFNLFPHQCVNQRMAIWAETLVAEKELKRLKSDVVGVKEAFSAKENIQLVVTGLGDADDEHDMLSQFFRSSNRKLESGIVGNVQYRPFSANGPVREKKEDLRAVTLFELDELVSMCRQKNRYVILMARQCGLCGKNRARVLRHLLGRDDLMVFSHLVVDLATADALLAEASGGL